MTVLELKAGEPIPSNEVKLCVGCRRPYYLARSKSTNNWTRYKSGGKSDRAAYKAAAVLTDTGYVAAPFQSHHGTLPGYGGGTRRSTCPHSAYIGYSQLSEAKRADIDQKIKAEDVQLRSQLRVNPPTPEMLARVDYHGRILPSNDKPQEAAPVITPAQPTLAPSAKPKGFTNKFPGNCVGCNTRVGAGEGLTSRGASGWEVRCVGCHHG